MYETLRPNTHERRRSAKESFEYLNSLLQLVSNDISAELKKKYGIEGLIDEECNIQMDAYKDLNPKAHAEDTEFVEQREKEWSGIGNANTRSFRLESYGLPPDATDKQIIEKYLDERAKEKSRQLEMMMTILLHKAFGKKYVVVRSAKYDDYAGGVDNVIVNKETGDVICAFDEVRENSKSNRRSEKDDTVLNKARAGGAELIYGFSIFGGKIKLKSMSDLPLFCLGLDGDEYDELADAIEYGNSSELNDIEQKFLDKIIKSIGEQKDRLLADKVVQKNTKILGNLNKVDELLAFK